MEVFHTAPKTTEFVALSEHQSQTPESFYDGPAVLYHHISGSTLVFSKTSTALDGALGRLLEQNARTASTGEDEAVEEAAVDGIDIFVTSDKFLIWSASKETGIGLTYPSITLHAVQRLRLPESASTRAGQDAQGLYFQIATNNSSDDYSEEDFLELSIVPHEEAPSSASTGENLPNGEAESTTESPVQALFAAVSACANLHPDPIDQESAYDEDETYSQEGEGDENASYTILSNGGTGLPPPMPGSGGWITAENMAEYIDADGNLDMEKLAGRAGGPSVGSRRAREDDETELANGEADETKWRRLDTDDGNGEA